MKKSMLNMWILVAVFVFLGGCGSSNDKSSVPEELAVKKSVGQINTPPMPKDIDVN